MFAIREAWGGRRRLYLTLCWLARLTARVVKEVVLWWVMLTVSGVGQPGASSTLDSRLLRLRLGHSVAKHSTSSLWHWGHAPLNSFSQVIAVFVEYLIARSSCRTFFTVYNFEKSSLCPTKNTKFDSFLVFFVTNVSNEITQLVHLGLYLLSIDTKIVIFG